MGLITPLPEYIVMVIIIIIMFNGKNRPQRASIITYRSVNRMRNNFNVRTITYDIELRVKKAYTGIM